MRQRIALIALIFLCSVLAVLATNSTIIADTLSYFVVNPNATNTVNGVTGSRGLQSVSPKGEGFIEDAPTVIVGAYNEYAFGSITAAYTTALTNSANLRWCKFRSSLDAAVLISYDASANKDYVGPGEVSVIDYKANDIVVTGNISVKRYSGAATVGALFISCGS